MEEKKWRKEMKVADGQAGDDDEEDDDDDEEEEGEEEMGGRPGGICGRGEVGPIHMPNRAQETPSVFGWGTGVRRKAACDSTMGTLMGRRE